MTHARLILVEQNAVALGGHYYAYTRSLARAALEAGLSVTVLQNQALMEGWGSGVERVPAFMKSRLDSDAVEIRPWRGGNIAFDLVEAIGATPAGRELILFPTLDYGELLQLLHLWTSDPSMLDRRTAHLLLRYDPGMLRDSMELFRPYFDRVSRSALLRSRLFFHTDTAALTRELAGLSGLSVTTLPVTFDQTPLRARLDTPDDTPAGSLTAVYLGDARLEKNYTAIPSAVAHLWADYVRPGRLTFVVQSNFNVPGGEPGILAAAQRLGQYPPDRVRVLPRPLGLDAYQDELAAADIVLLPYDADRYRLRSSGILVEAMAAGKPVVTTAGSWMAGEVDASHAVVIEDLTELGRAIAAVVDDYPRYRAAARAKAPDALEKSSGRAFIAALLATDVPDPAAAADILFVLDADDLARAGGASDVALTRMTALEKGGVRTALMIVAESGEVGDVTEARRRAGVIGLREVLVGSVSGAPHRGTDRAMTFAGLARHFGRIELDRNDAETLGHLAPRAVWLSRASHIGAVRALGMGDLPLVCSVDDLDSFRVALEEGRIVEAQDLADEAALLGACVHLVTASPTSVEGWEKVLGGAPITLVPLELEAAASPAVLAGALDLADVASRAGLRLGPEDGFASGRVSRSKLSGLESLDMIIVVGDEEASREGAVRFCDEVFRPILAGFGFTLLVVNAPDRLYVDDPPAGLLVAGRADRLDLLYAAAKIAVVPVGDLARATPQLWTAVAHAVPVVANPAALRGAPPNLAGIAVAETPVALAAEITALLSSETARRHAIAAMTATPTVLGPDARENLERVLTAILGDETAWRPPSLEARTRREPLVVEWGPLARAANGLVHAWLGGLPLDLDALQVLAGYDTADLADLLRVTVDAASAGRFAALADADQRGDAVILLAVGAAAGPDRAVRVEDGGIAFDARHDLGVDLVWADGAPDGQVNEPSFVPDESVSVSDPRRRRWVRARDTRPSARFVAVPLHVQAEGATSVIVSQTFPVRTVATQVLGRALVEADWRLDRDGAALILGEDEHVVLNLPAILTPGAPESWVEIVTDEAAELRVDQGARNLPVLESRVGGLKIHRARIEMPASCLLAIRIASASPRAAVFEARVHIVLAHGGRAAGDLLDAVADPPSDGEAERIALALATLDLRAGRAVPETVQSSLMGRPTRGTALHRLQTRVRDAVRAGEEPLAALRATLFGLDLGPGGWSQAALEATLAAVSPEHAMGARTCSYVASPGLTAEIRARFADEVTADAATCLSNGEPLTGVPYAGSVRAWRDPGRYPARGASWVHALTFVDMDGAVMTPLAVSVAFRLPATVDPETGAACLDRLGFHAPEYDNGRPVYIWTGPRPTSRVALPVAPVGAGRIAMSLINAGLNGAPDDIALYLNDRPLARDDRDGRIVATFPAMPDAPALMEFRLTVAHVKASPPDPRELGIALGDIEVEIQLGASDASVSP